MCGVGAGRACRSPGQLSWLARRVQRLIRYSRSTHCFPPNTRGMCWIEPLNLGVLPVNPHVDLSARRQGFAERAAGLSSALTSRLMTVNGPQG